MVTIELKGREIPLLYTTWEMKEIQESIAPIQDAIKLICGKDPDAEEEKEGKIYGGDRHLDAVAKAVKILGNAGLEENGEAADLTEKKILRAMKPTQIPEVVNKIMDAMAEGMRSERPEKEDEGPVDVTLEEINRKKGGTN